MKYWHPKLRIKRKEIQNVLLAALLLACRQTAHSQVLPVDPAKAKPAATHTQPAARRPSPKLDDSMVLVQAGTFNMGDAKGQSDANDNPMHSVTVSSFYISKYLVTQAQWKAVMGNNPSNHQCDSCPVENISWDDAQAYCQIKSRQTGKTWRLPTEAEWEYAARGGNKSQGYTYSGSNNINDVAWYKRNSGMITQPVGQKQPNELGLYDMTGNVLEWCSDWYDRDYYGYSPTQNPQGAAGGRLRVVRGSIWINTSRACRISDRNYNAPDNPSGIIGFRPVVSF
jgi:formylglycine-generating enzyme required for sulfatase activity